MYVHCVQIIESRLLQIEIVGVIKTPRINRKSIVSAK